MAAAWGQLTHSVKHLPSDSVHSKSNDNEKRPELKEYADGCKECAKHITTLNHKNKPFFF